jgi:MscS family membrane protein
MNETINNLGERKNRRFNTNITVAYHTPPELLEKFVSGLRAIALNHPEIEKEDMFIHLNNLNSSSMDIIFHVYFKTNEWGQELKWREEVIMLILHLAKELGVQFAYPSTSLYIESMPEKKSNVPDYNEKIEQSEKKLTTFTKNLKDRFSVESEESDLESSENNY